MLLKFKLLILAFGASSTIACATSTVDLVDLSWKALRRGDYDVVYDLTTQCIERNYKDAVKMQHEINLHPDNYLYQNYFPLHDTAECIFIRAESYRLKGEIGKAIDSYQMIIDYFRSAEVQHLNEWPWHPAEQAQQMINDLREKIKGENNGKF